MGELLAAAAAVLTTVFQLLQSQPLLYVGSLVSMAGFVLLLLGLSGASLAHPGYRSASRWVWINVAIGLVMSLPVLPASAVSTVGVLNVAVMLMTVFYVCKTTAALHMERGEQALAERGALAWKLYAGSVAASLIINVAAGFFALTLAAVVLSGLALFLRLAAEVAYLLFLWASQKNLRTPG